MKFELFISSYCIKITLVSIYFINLLNTNIDISKLIVIDFKPFLKISKMNVLKAIDIHWIINIIHFEIIPEIIILFLYIKYYAHLVSSYATYIRASTFIINSSTHTPLNSIKFTFKMQNYSFPSRPPRIYTDECIIDIILNIRKYNLITMF